MSTQPYHLPTFIQSLNGKTLVDILIAIREESEKIRRYPISGSGRDAIQQAQYDSYLGQIRYAFEHKDVISLPPALGLTPYYRDLIEDLVDRDELPKSVLTKLG